MSTQSLPYSIVDAFTSKAFRGNPAAVIVLDSTGLPDTTLQTIAAEFNLSETAFVTPIDPTRGRFGLRWFTPTLEIPLCGHATLASASVLFSGTIVPENVKLIEFETVYSGVLTAKALPDGRIELEFPPGEVTTADESLSKEVKDVVDNAFQVGAQPSIRFIGTGHGASYDGYMLIEIDTDYDLEKARVTPESFMKLAPRHKIIIVTQRGESGKETFQSRVFCPGAGVPEDPVTGSAHSMLGPYWDKQLQITSTGKAEMLARQVSARCGEMGVEVDHRRNKCMLRGNATLVAKGELFLPN